MTKKKAKRNPRLIKPVEGAHWWLEAQEGGGPPAFAIRTPATYKGHTMSGTYRWGQRR